MSEDTATVACRFCATQNRFPVEKALTDLSKAICGKCHSGLLRVNGEPLTSLSKEDIAHPWDREARAKLEALPFVEEVLSKVLSSTFDKLDRFRHLGGGIKVSERQAPRLHRLYLEAAGRLDVDPPPLFIIQSPIPNAYTSGAGAPVVVVTTALLDLLDDRGLVGVFGHELAHVKLEHVLFRKVAELLAMGALKALNLAGLANIALTPIKALLFKWYQMSELSADRGELIASGSLATHIRTSMLLAGGSAKIADELDISAYVDQAHEAEAMRDGDLLISISELFENQARSHPVSVWRVHHILEWARSQTFFDLLAGRGGLRLEDAPRLER